MMRFLPALLVSAAICGTTSAQCPCGSQCACTPAAHCGCLSTAAGAPKCLGVGGRLAARRAESRSYAAPRVGPAHYSYSVPPAVRYWPPPAVYYSAQPAVAYSCVGGVCRPVLVTTGGGRPWR